MRKYFKFKAIESFRIFW